jgi:hypothetical protein
MTTPEQQQLATDLRAPFAPDDYKARTEEGTTKSGQSYSRTFTYVEDEKVMARLDDVFGPDGWDLEAEPVVLAPLVAVKVTIVAGGSKRQDFGYASADAKEPLKDATTDGIRRVGRTFGIARDVYEGKVAPGGGQIASQRGNAATFSPVAASQGQSGFAQQQPQQAPVAQPSADVLAFVNGGVNPAVAMAAASMNAPQVGDDCPTHPGQKLRGGDKGPDSLYHKQGDLPNGKADWHRPYAAPRR